jgi:hypothetical protein
MKLAEAAWCARVAKIVIDICLNTHKNGLSFMQEIEDRETS